MLRIPLILLALGYAGLVGGTAQRAVEHAFARAPVGLLQAEAERLRHGPPLHWR